MSVAVKSQRTESLPTTLKARECHCRQLTRTAFYPVGMTMTLPLSVSVCLSLIPEWSSLVTW